MAIRGKLVAIRVPLPRAARVGFVVVETRLAIGYALGFGWRVFLRTGLIHLPG